jgi:hypothetical protein
MFRFLAPPPRAPLVFTSVSGVFSLSCVFSLHHNQTLADRGEQIRRFARGNRILLTFKQTPFAISFANRTGCQMPIATLTFDLSDPDEQQEHLFALKGKDSRLSISELDEKLRRILKYPVEGQDDVGSFQLDERTILWVRRCLYEIVEDRNLPEVN